MYCFSTKPFPETGELTNSTFHSTVILSKPMHVFFSPANPFYVTVSDAGIKVMNFGDFPLRVFTPFQKPRIANWGA